MTIAVLALIRIFASDWYFLIPWTRPWNIPEIVPEKSHAPEAAKIHAKLVLLVKYRERLGDSNTTATVAAEEKISERTRIDLEITLDSPSSSVINATNLVAAIWSPNDATDDPIMVTSTTPE